MGFLSVRHQKKIDFFYCSRVAYNGMFWEMRWDFLYYYLLAPCLVGKMVWFCLEEKIAEVYEMRH